MLIWRHLFSKKILDRGRAYFEDDAVIDLVKLGNGYFAMVEGRYTYEVRIRTEGEYVQSMSCDCPYGGEGQNCKHMAATLFAIEAEETDQQTMWEGFGHQKNSKDNHTKELARRNIPKRIYPFVRKDDGKYHFFDFEQITSKLTIMEDKFELAKGLLDHDDLRIRDFSGYAESNQTEYIYTSEAHFGRLFESAEVTLSYKRLNHYRCTKCGCNSSFTWKTENVACEHILALLLRLSRQFAQSEPGDMTSLPGAVFMKQMLDQELQSTENIDKTKKVNLEFRIERRYHQLLMGLRIGTEKMYVVKNATELVEAVENKDKLKLGKSTELNFQTDVFDDKSQEIFQMVRGFVNEEKLRTQMFFEDGRGIPRRIGQLVPLFGGALDTVYDCIPAEGVAYEDKDEHRQGHLTKGESFTKFDVRIKKNTENGVFHGITMEADIPYCFRGTRGNYIIEDDKIYFLSKDDAKKMKAILMLGETTVPTHIGRRHLPEFYQQILPVLKEYCDVQDEDAEYIEQYLPDIPEFTFYLDAPNRVPSCSIEVHYGSDKYSVIETQAITDGEKRNAIREQAAVNVALEYFPLLNESEQILECRDDEDSIFELLESGIPKLMQYGDVQTTDRFQNLKIRRKPNVTMGISVESNLMDLKIQTDDISMEELLEVLKSYRQKKHYHRLKNGDFLQIDSSIAELSDMMDALNLSDKELLKGQMKLPVYRALYLDKMLESCEEIYANRDRKFRDLIRSFKTVKDSDFEVPETLKSILRPYQRYGFKWLSTLSQYGFGGILADDMGLGKTLQIISVLQSAKDNGLNGTALIITPASLVFNWKAEFEQYAPKLSVAMVTGTQHEREAIIQKSADYDVMVTSYDLLKRDIALYGDMVFEYEVIDEAQQIKNHATAASKSVKVIKAKNRYALTGTPIENRLSELWSIFDYLMPGYLYGYETFRKELETPIVKKKDEQAMERLKRMIAPFILRRLKQDVLKDLPEKLEKVHYAGFEEKQRLVYDAQVAKMKEKLESENDDSFRRNKLQMLAELMKIRQICCDPRLLFEDFDGSSAKLESCLELIQDAIEGGHKILLFSQFTSMLAIIEERLNNLKIPYYEITGATPKKTRLDLVNRFNMDSVPVFLISLKAGGTGLNLTGADIVIHYDPWWNVAAQNQATDRAHRIGQTKTVSVYKLIAKGTIEENILAMQLTKKEMADAILEGETGNFAEMTREDLLALLN